MTTDVNFACINERKYRPRCTTQCGMCYHAFDSKIKEASKQVAKNIKKLSDDMFTRERVEYLCREAMRYGCDLAFSMEMNLMKISFGLK
jgi:hypothetical protein